MKIEDIFNCGAIKCMRNGGFCIEVDGIRIVYTVSFNIGMITEIILKSENYKSNCKIEFDTKKWKVIKVEAIGFKADKVQLALEQCFRERGILYKPTI